MISTEGNSTCAVPNMIARTVSVCVKSGVILCLENSEINGMSGEVENSAHN